MFLNFFSTSIDPAVKDILNVILYFQFNKKKSITSLLNNILNIKHLLESYYFLNFFNVFGYEAYVISLLTG